MWNSEACVPVREWLSVLRLEQYDQAFQEAGLLTVKDCSVLTPDLLERMDITLPGHQRRILASLNKTLQTPPDPHAPPRQTHTHPPPERDLHAVPGEEGDHGEEERPASRNQPSPKARERVVPAPRQRHGRDKPVPKERPVSRTREQERDGHRERQVCSAETSGELKKPVPKERTKYHSVHVDPNSPTAHPPLPEGPQDPPLPPIPPRSTPNCPPQRFTPTPTPTPPSPQLSSIPASIAPPTRTFSHPSPDTPSLQTRPNSPALFLPTPQPKQRGKGRRKSPPISPSASTSSSCSLISSSSSSFSSSSLEQSEDRGAPPLPPKSSAAGAGPNGPPPIPRRTPVRPNESTPQSDSPVSETPAGPTPRVPPRSKTPCAADSTPLLARAATPPDVLLAVPVRIVPEAPPPVIRSESVDSSEYYEDVDPGYVPQSVNIVSREMFLPVPGQGKGRYNSLCSDDEQLDDDNEPITNNRNSWLDYGISTLQGSVYLPSNGRLAPPPQEDPAHLSVIKMGWLDKNPPQGSLYYQRRWVKLDVDHLRYFDNDKEVYSKRIISTSAITGVSNVGELKFEVVTHNRNFLFRAETETERNEWVSVLQDCVRGRQTSSGFAPASPLTPEQQGYLELKGLRSKLYTVVCGEKVFLYKNLEDYRLGVGISSIEMNVGNVKDTDRRSFDLTTPYRIFSFIAESEQLKDQWVEAMRDSIGEALSNSEVAEQIWAEPSNGYCADCRATKPEWASINLCVVVCKRCAGEHRGLGPSISKVRSLKMDRKVWTEELIKVFLLLGNERVNGFWAANVPPSEALSPSSCTEDRRRFIGNKYRHGKYRKYHPLYGNQRELNNALCINVQCSDVLETLSLLFCGADVNCSSDQADWPSPLALAQAHAPSPLALAQAHAQTLQSEFLSHNQNTELPRLEVGGLMEAVHYSAPSSVSYNGFLFKTGSMARPITERKTKEEFSRRWCTLNDGCFSYYESDKNSTPNGMLKSAEIVCLAVNTPDKHGYEHTFELYSDSERLYLFGTDDPESHREWVKSITKTLIPASAEPLLRLGFERIGRLRYKDGLNLQSPRVGWFALVGSSLHAYLEDGEGEEIHLRKLQELSIQQENEVLVLVERGRTLYMEGERKLDFVGWCGAIQRAAGSSGDSLSQQQLTETDIPVLVDRCIDYITQCGLTSEGIYRKSGVNSRVAALCEAFRQDARRVRLREGENQVDDVATTLKRFFREAEEGLFTSQDHQAWLSTPVLQDDSLKISQYQLLLNRLPRVNKATLRALVNHLYCVQRFAELNQMNLHNLAIVFGPTLFQTDGKDYTAGRVIEDLIQHYTQIFDVDEQQLNRQLDEITVIIKVRENLNAKVPASGSGDFICTVYLEEKKETAEQHVKIPGSMTAAELTCEILDRRKITVREKDYWSCWEVSEKEETERPLHHLERVLPILHSLGTDSHLLIKKQVSMEAMLIYLASKVDVSKHGMVKFREERSILGLGLSSGSFHDRYFILTTGSFRMYKEVRSNRPERDWNVKNLKVYLGIKKKLRPPTCWGLTVVYEGDKLEKWYLCCDTQSEMREWYASFLSIQFEGNVWPTDAVHLRVSRALPLDTRHGNVSLIPLRGSENEMRNSVAAFSQDPLAVSRFLQSPGLIECYRPIRELNRGLQAYRKPPC